MRMGFHGGAAAVLLVAFAGVVAADKAPDSGSDPKGGSAHFHYTNLDLDMCETVTGGVRSNGRTHWRCAGLTEQWPVHVFRAEGAYAVSYGADGEKEPAARAEHVAFDGIHDTLEWVKAGESEEDLKPVATILRFFLNVESPGGKTRKHPILVVTQLVPGAVCQIAYVDARANPKANRDARRAALRLAGKHNCDAEPELVGPQTAGIFME